MIFSRKIHRFYLNFAFWVFLLLGFVIAGILKISNFSHDFWLFLSLVFLLISFWRARVWVLCFIFASGLVLGFWRFSNFAAQKELFKQFNGKIVTVRGIVVEDPDVDQEKGISSIKIDIYEVNSAPISGKLFAKIKNPKKLRRADEIILKGKMRDGFGSFSASMPRSVVVRVILRSDFVRDSRDWFSDGVSENISSPSRELGLGYLLGQKNSLPTDLKEALRITALTHIVVASGYNLTVLVNFSRKKFGKISKKLATFMSILFICSFVLVVGFSPSMVRAGIVALLGVIFWYFGRKVNPYFLLTLVAGMTLFINPSNLFDLGWQLSFGSFFGVLVVSPLIQDFLFEDSEKLNSLIKTFFETMSAQIATLPIIVYTFGVLSSVSIVANMLVLPFIPMAMLLTFLTGIFARIFMPIAKFFGFLAEIILKCSIVAINYFSKIQNAQVEVKFGIFDVIIFYVILILVVVVLENINSKKDSLTD